MHVVTTSSQVVKVILRGTDLTLSLDLRDEQQRTTTTKSITGTIEGNFVSFDLDFTPIEGNFYTFKLNGGNSELVYYGMLFCTDQANPEAYKITQGEYTEQSSANDYKFI
tara:strand:- start:857 stop:1186 length:330 start_codon:yes stop_codon:yes gene_type:complete